MYLASCLIMFALLGKVEPFKLKSYAHQSDETVHPLPPQPHPPQPHPLVLSQASFLSQQPEPSYIEQEAIGGAKGGKPERYLQTAYRHQPLLPQTLAYVIIRPIQAQYQYLEPVRQLAQPIQQQQFVQQEEPQYPVKGQQPIEPQYPTKVQQQQIIEPQYPAKGQQQQIVEPQYPAKGQQIEQQSAKGASLPPPAHPQPLPDYAEDFHAKKLGAFAKLKGTIDRLTATALSKITLGSTYQVVNEEFVKPPPQPEPLPDQQHEEIPTQQQEELPPSPPESYRLEQLPQQQVVKGFRETEQQQEQIKQEIIGVPEQQVKESIKELGAQDSLKREPNRLTSHQLTPLTQAPLAQAPLAQGPSGPAPSSSSQLAANPDEGFSVSKRQAAN